VWHTSHRGNIWCKVERNPFMDLCCYKCEIKTKSRRRKIWQKGKPIRRNGKLVRRNRKLVRGPGKWIWVIRQIKRRRCADGCFPPDATVEVKGKGTVAMQDLQIRDEVRSRYGYSKVFAFALRVSDLKDRTEGFLQIATESSSSSNKIELSPSHYLFVGRNRVAKMTSDIHVGDDLTLLPSGTSARVRSGLLAGKVSFTQ